MRLQMFGWRGSSANRSFARRRGPSSCGLKCLQNGGPRGLLEQSAQRGGGGGGGGLMPSWACSNPKMTDKDIKAQ